LFLFFLSFFFFVFFYFVSFFSFFLFSPLGIASNGFQSNNICFLALDTSTAIGILFVPAGLVATMLLVMLCVSLTMRLQHSIVELLMSMVIAAALILLLVAGVKM
jgi:hypothetical protein